MKKITSYRIVIALSFAFIVVAYLGLLNIISINLPYEKLAFKIFLGVICVMTGRYAWICLGKKPTKGSIKLLSYILLFSLVFYVKLPDYYFKAILIPTMNIFISPILLGLVFPARIRKKEKKTIESTPPSTEKVVMELLESYTDITDKKWLYEYNTKLIELFQEYSLDVRKVNCLLGDKQLEYTLILRKDIALSTLEHIRLRFDNGVTLEMNEDDKKRVTVIIPTISKQA